AGQSAAQTGQLGVGQRIQFMNGFRAPDGQPPIDPNNIPGAFTPTPANGAGAPVASAPVGAPSAPPVSGAPVAPPNAGAQAPGAMPAIPSMPGAPVAPNTQSPAVNPADAMRAMYVRMARAAAGLPDFA